MTIEAYVQGFGCIPEPRSYSSAEYVVIPVPLEVFPAEAPGVALGPMAVLGASRFIETYDAELRIDPLDRVATLDAISFTVTTEESSIAQIEKRISAVIKDGKTPLCLGGERTIALPAAQSARANFGDVGVILVSRRPGFLEASAGRLWSVETIGRRLIERFPVAFIGQRSWSSSEAEYMDGHKDLSLVTARALRDNLQLPLALTSALPARVHLSIDVGVLDPAILSMAGNNEPGGLGWYDLMRIIGEVFRRHDVVSCDISGFAPQIGQVASGLVVAQLVLRCLALMARA